MHSQKNTYIAAVLAVAALGAFAAFGFFGRNASIPTASSPEAQVANPQAVLDELRNTGTVADVRIIDALAGKGAAARRGDTLTVNYVGALPDGTVFDSSASHGQPFTFVLGPGVIEGWRQGLVGMKEGGRRILVIPPQLAYGEAGAGEAIPPNATLIFEIDLVSVNGESESGQN